MKTSKRLLSLLLAVVMVFSLIPAAVPAASAAEPVPEGPVTAYLSMAHDTAFMEDSNGEAVALRELTVPYFDLKNYGLEQFYFQKENYTPGDLKPEDADPAVYEGKVTVLHMMIYATEVLKYGVAPENAGKGYLKTENLMQESFNPKQTPGSLWIDRLWGYDGNMNYYVNHAFPMSAPQFGSTLDQRLLRQGDVVTFGHFTDTSFYQDSRAPFNHLEVNGAKDRLALDASAQVSLQVIHDGGGVSGDPTTYNKIDYPVDVYAAAAAAAPVGDVTQWVKVGTTDAAGALTGKTAGELAELAGSNDILIGVPGQLGQDFPEAICVAPAAFRLTVAPANPDQGAASSVITLIDALPAAESITKDHAAAIEAASKAYEALTPEQKRLVTNQAKLQAAVRKLAELSATPEDVTAAQNADKKITSIGKVTLSSSWRINSARNAYNSLTEVQKALVTKYDVLLAAEAEFDRLKAADMDTKIEKLGEITLASEKSINNARKAYDNLTDVQKALVTKLPELEAAEATLNTLKAKAVENQIAALPDTGVTLDQEQAILEARTGYDALNEAQKALVPNLAKLEAAEKALAEIKSAPVMELIAALPDASAVTAEDYAQIKAAREAFDALNAGQQRMVTNREKLFAAENKLADLKQPQEVEAYWPSFRGCDNNMAIVNAATPTSRETAQLKWNKKLGQGWGNAPSVQIIVDNSLIVMSNSTLYKLNLQTGEILQQAQMAGRPDWGYTPPTYAAGMIFCPLGGGMVQAFDAKTLESLWIYKDVLGGQALSPITYADGMIYTGFWNQETKEANYAAIQIKDENPAKTNEAKEAVWTKEAKGGYYWAGSVVVGDAVIFGTDDGTSGSTGDGAHLYALNKKTGAVISDLTGLTGDQRSTIAYSAEKGRVYFTTKGGYLYSAAVDAVSGALSDLKASKLTSDQSTSTPVVYGDQVYVCCGAGVGGGDVANNFTVCDAGTLEELYKVGMKAYPQCSALLSTAYLQTEGKLYFYLTYNGQPGGITLIKVDPTKKTAEAAEKIELYDAAGFEQYCITSIICGPDGTLYYKNDSCNVLAVGSNTAYLTDLTDDVQGSWNFPFESGRTDYTLAVPVGTEQVVLTAVPGAGTVEGGNTITAALTDGTATAEIVVKNGNDSRTYTVHIRSMSQDASAAVKVNESNGYNGFKTVTASQDGKTLVAFGLSTGRSFYNVWAEPADKNADVKVFAVENVGGRTEIEADQSISITSTSGGHDRYAIYPADASKPMVVKAAVTAEDGVTKSETLVVLTTKNASETAFAAGLTITPNPAELEANGTLQLVAAAAETLGTGTLEPLTWTSSNEQAATVNADGKLTWVGAGETTVTARGLLSEAACQVTVKEYSEDQRAADSAAQLIDALPAEGEITPESEAAITAARTAYDALTEAQKALVQNLETLEAAEAKLAELKQAASDAAAAKAVNDRIAAIGKVTLESEAAITEARAAYEALTEEQKALITELEVLEAAERALAQLKAVEVTVTVSMEQDNYYTVLPQTAVVSSALSDFYGYTDTVTIDKVSALDVLIRAHELLFAEAFTPETKNEFLAINDSGFITTMMGEVTSAVGFAVNGMTPNDGVIGGYGTYTGYAVNQAPVINNDVVQFFFYNPDGYYGEIYTNFADGEQHITKLELVENAEKELKVLGYSYVYEGLNKEIKWKAVKEMQVCTVVMEGENAGMLVPIEGAITDENGAFLLKLPAAGTYYLAVTSDPENITYVIPQLCRVTVISQAEIDKAAAKAVDDQIAAIGDVTLDQKQEIEDARKAYEALTDEQKALVDNLEVLENAEAYLELLENAEKPAPRPDPLPIPQPAEKPDEKPVVKLPFADVAESDWYYDSVREAWEKKLIDGMDATHFEPNGTLTVAQAIKLAAVLHQREMRGQVTLTNGTDTWYSTYVAYAVANDVIEEAYERCTAAQMNAPITRSEFVHVFYGAMPESAYAEKNTVADNAIPDVKLDSVHGEEIYTFYRAGILNGSDDAGTFYPGSSIKRSEVAAILIRMYDRDVRVSTTIQ